MRLRIGPIPPPPDLVLFPEADEEVRRVLEFCEEKEFRVIPFGGGTSVVGSAAADPASAATTQDVAASEAVLIAP